MNLPGMDHKYHYDDAVPSVDGDLQLPKFTLPTNSLPLHHCGENGVVLAPYSLQKAIYEFYVGGRGALDSFVDRIERVIQGQPHARAILFKSGEEPPVYSAPERAKFGQLFMTHLSARLGCPLGVTVPKGGKVIQELIATPSSAVSQDGTGSKAELFAHMEDAHLGSHRPRLVIVNCITGHNLAHTVVTGATQAELTDHTRITLQTTTVSIEPDSTIANGTNLVIPLMNAAGDLLYDPLYTHTKDPEVIKAIAEVNKVLKENAEYVTLGAGDFLIIKNGQLSRVEEPKNVVHARTGYVPDFENPRHIQQAFVYGEHSTFARFTQEEKLLLSHLLAYGTVYRSETRLTGKFGTEYQVETDILPFLATHTDIELLASLVWDTLREDEKAIDSFVAVPETPQLLVNQLNRQLQLSRVAQIPTIILRAQEKPYQGDRGTIHSVVPITQKGLRLCLIEDDTVSGGTVLEYLERLQKSLCFSASITSLHIVTIFSRGDSLQKIKEAALKLFPDASTISVRGIFAEEDIKALAIESPLTALHSPKVIPKNTIVDLSQFTPTIHRFIKGEIIVEWSIKTAKSGEEFAKRLALSKQTKNDFCPLIVTTDADRQGAVIYIDPDSGDLVPNSQNKVWSYNGFAPYGAFFHDGSIVVIDHNSLKVCSSEGEIQQEIRVPGALFLHSGVLHRNTDDGGPRVLLTSTSTNSVYEVKLAGKNSRVTNRWNLGVGDYARNTAGLIIRTPDQEPPPDGRELTRREAEDLMMAEIKPNLHNLKLFITVDLAQIAEREGAIPKYMRTVGPNWIDVLPSSTAGKLDVLVTTVYGNQLLRATLRDGEQNPRVDEITKLLDAESLDAPHGAILSPRGRILTNSAHGRVLVLDDNFEITYIFDASQIPLPDDVSDEMARSEEWIQFANFYIDKKGEFFLLLVDQRRSSLHVLNIDQQTIQSIPYPPDWGVQQVRFVSRGNFSSSGIKMLTADSKAPVVQRTVPEIVSPGHIKQGHHRAVFERVLMIDNASKTPGFEPSQVLPYILAIESLTGGRTRLADEFLDALGETDYATLSEAWYRILFFSHSYSKDPTKPLLLPTCKQKIMPLFRNPPLTSTVGSLEELTNWYEIEKADNCIRLSLKQAYRDGQITETGDVRSYIGLDQRNFYLFEDFSVTTACCPPFFSQEFHLHRETPEYTFAVKGNLQALYYNPDSDRIEHLQVPPGQGVRFAPGTFHTLVNTTGQHTYHITLTTPKPDRNANKRSTVYTTDKIASDSDEIARVVNPQTENVLIFPNTTYAPRFERAFSFSTGYYSSGRIKSTELSCIGRSIFVSEDGLFYVRNSGGDYSVKSREVLLPKPGSLLQVRATANPQPQSGSRWAFFSMEWGHQ